MAEVQVSRDDLAAGDLPRICVVTGRPADGTVPFRFDSLPTWTWVLLLAGIVPFLVAWFFVSESVRGEVPVLAEVVERYHRRRRQGVGLAVAGLAVIFLAAGLDVDWGAWLGLATMAAGMVVTASASRLFITGRLEGDGTVVRLRRVHPRFAEALAARSVR